MVETFFLSEKEISEMKANDYKIINDDCHIIAYSIDQMELVIKCPFCWSKYNKNDEPSKNAKKGILHFHGSDGGNCNNRITKRVPHCHKSEERKGEFVIYITNATIRFKH